MTWNHRFALLVVVLLEASVALSSCTKPPVDPFCSYEALPQSTEVAAGEGVIQIVAVNDEYFYVYDSSGKQFKSGSTNRALDLKPGQYKVKLNNSSHSANVQSKTLTSAPPVPCTSAERPTSIITYSAI